MFPAALQARFPFFPTIKVTRTRLALSTLEQSLTPVEAPTTLFLSSPFPTLSKHHCLGVGDWSAPPLYSGRQRQPAASPGAFPENVW